MPEREFELYLDLLGKLLKLSPEQKSSISDELRDHLEERFEELVQSGQSRDDAIRQALDEFGDAAGLAVDFTKVSPKKIRRAIMRTTAVTTAVTALAAFLFVYFGPGKGGTEGPGGTIARAEPGDNKPVASGVDYLADKELFPEVLDRPTSVDFFDTPLSEVMLYLSDLHKVPIIVDRTGLEDAGLALDEPVTLRAESLPRAYFEARQKAEQEKKPLPPLPPNADEVPLRLLLDWICEPLQLGWYMDTGLIHVTTLDREFEHQVPRSHDITGLLKSGLPKAQLIQLIQTLDASWIRLDGEGGTHAIVRNVLTVRQNWGVHRDIAKLLSILSSARHKPYLYLTDHDRHARLLNQLQQKVSADFVDTPLSECVEFFADALEIRIFIDATALDNDGIPTDEPINLALSDVQLQKAIAVALDPLRLTLVVINGRLTLTTFDVAEEHLHAVLYDVSDVFSGDDVEAFSEAIQTTTDGQWEDIDGHGGWHITVVNSGQLLIHQTDAVHSQIRNMIAWSRNTRIVDDEAATKSKAEAAALSAHQLTTRFYRMDRDSAEDLLTLLPEVIEPDSWKTEADPDGGFIRKVAAGRRIMEVKGPILSGQAQLGSYSGMNPGQPAKDAAQPKVPEVKSSVIIPEAILVIRQSQDVHRKIDKFLNGLGITWKSTDEDGKVLGGTITMGGGGGMF